MKLIDMLVEDGLNGWQWPDGVEAITQDSDKSINKYKTAKGLEINERGTWRYSSSWKGYLLRSCEMSSLADDCATSIITREQYEAALAAKNDGWIEWGGGECPVPGDTEVLIKCKSEGAWDFRRKQRADGVSWTHNDSALDVIAYRLHKPTKSEQVRADAWNAYAGITMADDEADLNECIGHDAAPFWNGEGLPPVGCECEFISNDTSWGSVIVVGMDGDKVVIKPSGETYYGITPSEKQVFRPIRSEAERKRDEAIAKITDAICGEVPDTGMATAAKYAARAYDAIVAGKIPGVKLEV